MLKNWTASGKSSLPTPTPPPLEEKVVSTQLRRKKGPDLGTPNSLRTQLLKLWIMNHMGVM